MQNALWERQRRCTQSLFNTTDTNLSCLLSFTYFLSFVENFHDIRDCVRTEVINACVTLDNATCGPIHNTFANSWCPHLVHATQGIANSVHTSLNKTMEKGRNNKKTFR